MKSNVTMGSHQNQAEVLQRSVVGPVLVAAEAMVSEAGKAASYDIGVWQVVGATRNECRDGYMSDTKRYLRSISRAARYRRDVGRRGGEEAVLQVRRIQ